MGVEQEPPEESRRVEGNACNARRLRGGRNVTARLADAEDKVGLVAVIDLWAAEGIVELRDALRDDLHDATEA